MHRAHPQAPLNWRVEKMKLAKDKSALIYNEFLTLEGVPPETFAYLGGRILSFTPPTSRATGTDSSG